MCQQGHATTHKTFQYCASLDYWLRKPGSSPGLCTPAWSMGGHRFTTCKSVQMNMKHNLSTTEVNKRKRESHINSILIGFPVKNVVKKQQHVLCIYPPDYITQRAPAHAFVGTIGWRNPAPDTPLGWTDMFYCSRAYTNPVNNHRTPRSCQERIPWLLTLTCAAACLTDTTV